MGRIERVVRAICKADSVGKLIPVGETRKAWEVRIPQGKAALLAMVNHG